MHRGDEGIKFFFVSKILFYKNKNTLESQKLMKNVEVGRGRRGKCASTLTRDVAEPPSLPSTSSCSLSLDSSTGVIEGMGEVFRFFVCVFNSDFRYSKSDSYLRHDTRSIFRATPIERHIQIKNLATLHFLRLLFCEIF